MSRRGPKVGAGVPLTQSGMTKRVMTKNTKSRKKRSSTIFDLIRKEAGLKTFGIKQARAGVKNLVKQGVLSPRTNTQDISKYALSKLRKFYSVVQGKSAALSINPGEREAYETAGIPVVNDRAIIPRKKGQSVKRVRQKNGAPAYEVQTRDKYGQVRMHQTHVLSPVQDLQDYLVTLRAQGLTLKKGESVGFRFFGFHSKGLFMGLDSAIDFFERYQSVQTAINKDDGEAMSDIIQNLQFVRVRNGDKWIAEGKTVVQERREYRRKYQRKVSPHAGFYADRKAVAERIARATMTPEQKEEYKRKARVRAARSRANRTK